MSEAAPAGGFPTTRWTAILAAQGTTEGRREALRELLVTYWAPLYAYVRRRGLTPDDARDAVQGFCVHLLEGDLVARLDPSRGRLRDYLRTSLKHYVANLHAAERAARRGGGVTVLSLDPELAERVIEGAPADPEAAFDQAWARGVLERALAHLVSEFASGARRGPFHVVAAYFSGGDAPSYAEVAREHHMSIPQVKSFLHRARLRYRELILAEVRDTLPAADAGEDEVQTLLRALQP